MEHLRMSNIKGTDLYWPPEILEIYEKIDLGEKILACLKDSIGSDIFAEGLTFAYILLNGKHLYGTTREEIIKNLKDNKPNNVSKIPPKYIWLCDLILDMLKTNPKERLYHPKWSSSG